MVPKSWDLIFQVARMCYWPDLNSQSWFTVHWKYIVAIARLKSLLLKGHLRISSLSNFSHLFFGIIFLNHVSGVTTIGTGRAVTPPRIKIN